VNNVTITNIVIYKRTYLGELYFFLDLFLLATAVIAFSDASGP
jgi:hypothetical protein